MIYFLGPGQKKHLSTIAGPQALIVEQRLRYNPLNSIVNQGYVATIVDSQYIALRVGDFANNFGTAAVVGALSIDANTGGDTLTFAAGDGVNITTNVASKKITISAIAGQGLDFGSILGPVGFSLDMGAI